MITVRSSNPTRFRSYNIGDWNWGNADYMVGDHLVVHSKKFDAGILDDPWSTELPGYHDCFHYDVAAEFTAEDDSYAAEWDPDRGRYIVTFKDGHVWDNVICITTENGTCTNPDSYSVGSYWNSLYDHGTVYYWKTEVQWEHHANGDDGDNAYWKYSYRYKQYRIPEEGLPYWVDYGIYAGRVDTNPWQGSWHRSRTNTVPEIDLSRFPWWSFSLYRGKDGPLYEAIKRRSEEICAFGDLTSKAADSVRVTDMNSIMYLRDLARLGQLAKGLIALKNANPSSAKSLLKQASSTYLSAHYGLRLSIKDTEGIADEIDRIDRMKYAFQTIGAQEHVVIDLPGSDSVPCSVEMRLTARIDSLSRETFTINGHARRFIRGLYDLDLAPTAENVWDMIPLSFVADWFVPIGDMLSNLEDKHFIQTFDVQRAFYSRKCTWARRHRFEWNGFWWSGPASYKIYDRTCQNYLALPPMRVDSPVKDLPKHWLEASALFFSRL